MSCCTQSSQGKSFFAQNYLNDPDKKGTFIQSHFSHFNKNREILDICKELCEYLLIFTMENVIVKKLGLGFPILLKLGYVDRKI